MSSLSRVSSERLQDIREAADQIAALKQRIVELEKFVASALEEAEQPAGLVASNVIAFPESIAAPDSDVAGGCSDDTAPCNVVPLPNAMRSLILNPPAQLHKSDDLTLIRGIDTHIARQLAAEKFTRYADIANLTSESVSDLCSHLNVGRELHRQNWIEQAAILAQGKMTAFAVSTLTDRLEAAGHEDEADTDQEIEEPPPPRSIVIVTEPLTLTGDKSPGFLPSSEASDALQRKTIAHQPEKPERDWGQAKAMMASLACTAVIAVSSGLVGPGALVTTPKMTSPQIVNSYQNLGSQTLAQLFRSFVPTPL